MFQVDVGIAGEDMKMVSRTEPLTMVRALRERRILPPLGMGAVAFTLILLLISAITLNVSFALLQGNREEVERSNAILRQMGELQGTLRAAETGQRGYLLTGEPRYLKPYRQAIGHVWIEFDQLGKLVEHPTQVERLRTLRSLIEAKLAELKRTIELRSLGYEEALMIVRTDEGQRLMEEFEHITESFHETERDLLEARAGHEERQVRQLNALAAATGLLALISAGFGVFLYFRQREHDELIRLNAVLEDRVEERTVSLTEANRELDAFAYTISHDLRAPLRAIHGYADALVEDYSEALPQQGRQYSHRIVAAASRMDALIEDLLAYSRMAREEITIRPVSLSKLIDRAVSDAKQLIEETNADVEIEQPLPEVHAHAPMLRQVIDNLLSNGVKFVVPGVKPKVRIWAERRGESARLWVEDNGIGIDSAHQERIFHPFERLHGIETYPGTGIGLAIVHKGMERIGGASGVVSEPGQGSRFWIDLPIAGVEN
jgi:signal transduction histidine kinase